MKSIILILVTHLTLTISTMAQEAIFSVILNKGDNTYGSENAFSPLLVGTELDKDDELILSENSYVALVHEATGASLELTKPGKISVAELEQKIKEQSSSVMAKYGKYLMDKINPNEEDNQNLNVTGAVERGEEGLIKVYLPSAMDVFGNEANISWRQADGINEYVVTIKNRFDEVIDEQSIHGTSFDLNLDKAKLQKEQLLIINVQAKENRDIYSRDYGIKRLSEDAKASINHEFTEVIQVANSENTLNNLLIATFFEENQLLVDAITYYQKAIELSQDTEGISKLYDGFLARNGMTP